MKTKTTPASLSIKGQDSKHTTVKWSIHTVNLFCFSVSAKFEAPSSSLDHVRGLDPVPSSRGHERASGTIGSPHELTPALN